MRKLLIAGALLTLVCAAPAMAGDDHGGDHMAEMAKCHVCKVMMPHMGDLMPVMKFEVIALDNGMATMTTITDEAKVGMYHKTCDAMHVAGEETAEFTAVEAEKNMCPMCYKMWDIMESGGKMSYGKTANGHLMVLSSDDKKIQKKIAELQKEYEAMMVMGG